MHRPDIILIVLDTQRADRLGCYGYDRPLSPNLDKFAQEGALFRQAVAPAQWTIPSHAAMFTGLYPTAHQVTQSDQGLSRDLAHVAELARDAAYETVGFCNNPLVGVLDNGFRRGFDTFYNYGGAIPNPLERPSRWPRPLAALLAFVYHWLLRLSYPIQDFFGRSDLAFRLSLNAWFTPLWARFAHFKGQNARAAADVCYFLETRERAAPEQPLFLFLNLMETHLPFWPPPAFVDQTAPYLRRDKAAQAIQQRWNREAYRWAAPLAKPLASLEAQVLSDLYDAEVAYQDSYLGPLFETLRQRRHAADTLTIIVADHGDGLGEHGYMGHAFVAYEELMHVPLLLHWPRQIAPGAEVTAAISTRRVYHTILAAAQANTATATAQGDPTALTLLHSIHGHEPEQAMAFAEIYPPLNFVKALERRQPELLEQFRCTVLRRAVVHDAWKLIQVDDQADELFDLTTDPAELTNVMGENSAETHPLDAHLRHFTGLMLAQRDGLVAGTTVDLADDALLRQLRGLGYVE